MTPQEERNKRFDEKFTDNGNGWSSVNIYRDGGRKIIDDLKSHITSEVHLTIEQVEKWVEEAPKIQDMWTGDTIRVEDLLTFLKELKK